jgi:hypothetical protein
VYLYLYLLHRTNFSGTVRVNIMRDIDLPLSADSSLFSRNYAESMSQLVTKITLDKVKNDLLLTYAVRFDVFILRCQTY